MWAERSEAGGVQQTPHRRRLSLYDGHDAAIALIFISVKFCLNDTKQKIEQLTEKESLSAGAEQRWGCLFGKAGNEILPPRNYDPYFISVTLLSGLTFLQLFRMISTVLRHQGCPGGLLLGENPAPEQESKER